MYIVQGNQIVHIEYKKADSPSPFAVLTETLVVGDIQRLENALDAAADFESSAAATNPANVADTPPIEPDSATAPANPPLEPDAKTPDAVGASSGDSAPPPASSGDETKSTGISSKTVKDVLVYTSYALFLLSIALVLYLNIRKIPMDPYMIFIPGYLAVVVMVIIYHM